MIETGTVVRSVAWSALESMTLVFLSFATILVVARLLGPADYGVAATVLVVMQLLNVAVEGLFNEALVQRSEIDDSHVDAAMWTALGVSVVLIVICAAVAGPAAAIYGDPRLAPLLRAGSVALLFNGYSGVKAAVIRRSFGFRHLAMRTMLARLTGCAIGLYMALSGYGPWSVIAQTLVGACLGAVALWYWSPRSVHRPPHLAPLLDLLRFVAPWLANQMVLFSLSRLFQLLAAYLFGEFQFGLLGMGFRITEMLREILGHIASSVGLPVFARVQHDPHRLAKQFLAATSTLCIVAFPCFAGLLICARTIITAVLGNEWLPAIPLIQVLTLGAATGFIAVLSYVTFSALGRPARALPLSLFEMALSLGLLLVVSRMGILAACVVWSVRQVLSAILLLGMSMRMLPLRARDIANALGGPILLALIFSAVLWPLDHIILAELVPAVRLLVLVPGGLLLLVAGIVLVRPELARAVIAQLPLRRKHAAFMTTSGSSRSEGGKI
jgi:teichuronic acid exporter